MKCIHFTRGVRCANRATERDGAGGLAWCREHSPNDPLPALREEVAAKALAWWRAFHTNGYSGGRWENLDDALRALDAAEKERSKP